MQRIGAAAFLHLAALLDAGVQTFACLQAEVDQSQACPPELWKQGPDVAIRPYMADARAGELPLLGGNYGKSSPYGFHDWEFILGETGLLAWDKTLAALTLNSGRAIMVLAMVWGAWLLWRGWRRQRG